MQLRFAGLHRAGDTVHPGIGSQLMLQYLPGCILHSGIRRSQYPFDRLGWPLCRHTEITWPETLEGQRRTRRQRAKTFPPLLFDIVHLVANTVIDSHFKVNHRYIIITEHQHMTNTVTVLSRIITIIFLIQLSPDFMSDMPQPKQLAVNFFKCGTSWKFEHAHQIVIIHRSVQHSGDAP